MFILPNVNYGRDLSATIPGTNNFKYWEVVSSELAVRHGIANIPTEAEWLVAEEFARKVLQPMRNKIGAVRISSWFRCKKLNDAAGSSDSSFHRTGGAADIEPIKVSLMACLEVCYAGEFSEIIAEYFPSGWVHCGYLVGDKRKMLKLKDHTHNYSRITIEELRRMYA